MERCPSGLRCKPGTFVWGQLHRGFESRPLRIKYLIAMKCNQKIKKPILRAILMYPFLTVLQFDKKCQIVS